MGWKVQHSAGDRPVEPWEHTAADSEEDATIIAGRLHRTGFYVNAIIRPDRAIVHDRDAVIVLLGNL